MDSGDLHYCEAFPSNTVDSLLAEDTSPSQNGGQFFNITVKLTETKLIFNPSKDDFDCLNDNTTEYRFANIPLASMEDKSTTLRMLSDIGVPEDAQDFMAFKILACAREMAQRTHRTWKLLPMWVVIYITTSLEEEADMDDCNEDEEEQDEFEGELMEDQLDTSLLPETVSYEELERVKVEESGFGVGRCTICLETYVIGTEAIRMPCLHLYHENCIVEWPQKSNSS